MSNRLVSGFQASYITALGIVGTTQLGSALSKSEHIGTIAMNGLGAAFGLAVMGIGSWGLKRTLLAKTEPTASPK